MVFFASVQGAAEAEKGFDISPPGGYNKQVFTCGVSTSVVRRLPKPNRRVRLPYPAPRRNGLRSIQKARSQDRAFLIPLCHSSFSPRNFALQTSAGAPAASRHVIASAISLAAIFCQNHRALILLLLTSPRNFALQTSAGAPAASRHVIASVISLAAAFCKKPPCALCPAALAGGKAQTSPCLRRFFNHNPTLNVGFADRPYKGHYSSST